MKPYIKKIDSKYRVFFIDTYGNLYGGVKSFKTWKQALDFGVHNCSYYNYEQ
jgi:hypothetical protein